MTTQYRLWSDGSVDLTKVNHVAGCQYAPNYGPIPFIGPGGSAVCTGDYDGSGDVGTADLLLLLANWGPTMPGHPADLDGNGQVGTSDLLMLPANWGPCPK